MAGQERENLKELLTSKHPEPEVEKLDPIEVKPYEWQDIRLFISSSFVDTHGERDLLIKTIIPDINRKFKDQFINITPIDLRWGVFGSDSAGFHAIQNTCLTQIDNSRMTLNEHPWFMGIRTERYGWVMDELRPKKEYPNPESYSWIDTLLEGEKHLSITSLECIHAAVPVPSARPANTLFFYKRHIENFEENIEEDRRWIFDYEYVSDRAQAPAGIANQYQEREDAQGYKKDRDELDEYLQASSFTSYTHYDCRYEKGDTRITGKKPSGENMGTGRVSGLEQFENMVRKDLIDAIEKNFKQAQCNMPEHELANLPFESVLRGKAKHFVGRDDLIDAIMGHCTSMEVKNSLMVVVGEPGQGKSSLMAKVSTQLMDTFRNEDDHFVFVHAVDSCPHSNDLEDMLIRLHQNLDHFVEASTPMSSQNLRGQHVDRLEKLAMRHSDKMFVILVDAVNQFHEAMKSWSMWWTTSNNAPSNIRFVVSTLPVENGTYANAMAHCPDAVVLEVDQMSEKEGAAMVKALLARYNKKLTEDDKISCLKNQMAILLEKNLSPLYLSTAVHAMRTQGVFEEMTAYIERLPSTIPNLFDALLESWSKDYGKKFIRYLTCIITLSKDGLLENLMTRLLDFIEKESNEEFECSFSVVFETLRGFLSAEGGGYIHFFHDQLNKVVRAKYLKQTSELELEIHNWFCRFYKAEISSQLVLNPSCPPSPYHEFCLGQVVHHEVQVAKLQKMISDGNKVLCYLDTLRNVFFVRERIVYNQMSSLTQQYLLAITSSADNEEVEQLEEWRKFSSIYGPMIAGNPEFAYNLAINHLAASPVYIDTQKLDGCDAAIYWDWVNKPEAKADPVVIKYGFGGHGLLCAASSAAGNMIALNDKNHNVVRVQEMKTGNFLCQVPVDRFTAQEVYSLTFNKSDTRLWIGAYGIVITYDLNLSKIVWQSGRLKDYSSRILWIECIDTETVMCGIECGEIFTFNEASPKINAPWSVGGYSTALAFHPTNKWVMAGIDNLLKCFTVDGVEVKSFEVGRDELCGIMTHPLHADILGCVAKYGPSDYRLLEVNLDTGDHIVLADPINGTCIGLTNPIFDMSGDRMFCIASDGKSLLACDRASKATWQIPLKGSQYIHNINSVPGTPLILAGANGGSFLVHPDKVPMPSSTTNEDSSSAGQIISCCFIGNGDEFITLSDNGEIAKWSTNTCTRTCTNTVAHSDPIPKPDSNPILKTGVDGGMVVPHPTEKYVIINTKRYGHNGDLRQYDTAVNFIHTDDLRILAVQEVYSGCSTYGNIKSMMVSNDGTKLALTVDAGKRSVVLDISDLSAITETHSYQVDEGIYQVFFPFAVYSTDIHEDNDLVVTSLGQGGLDTWSLTTSERVLRVREKGQHTWFAKFIPGQDLIAACEDGDDGRTVIVLSFKGEILHRFPGTIPEYHLFSVFPNGTNIVVGNSDKAICNYDYSKDKLTNIFYHHSTERYTCFAIHPTCGMVAAVDMDGGLYMLKMSQ